MNKYVKRALCIGSMTLLPLGVYSAELAVSTSIFHGYPHDALYAVSFEEERGIAVGDFGLVVSSNDGGASWERYSAAFTDLALFGVAQRQGRCIAVGQQGAIFTSADCADWKAVSPGTEERLLAVDVNSAGIAYAVGGFGTLLKSTDWGNHWETVTPDWQALSNGIEPHLYSVHVDADGTATVAGEFELILRSTSTGSWTVLHTGKKSLFSLRLLRNGEGYAVGQEGAILKTDDAGSTWHSLKSPTNAILNDVFADANGRAVVVGVYTILVSDDDGQSWRQDPSMEVGRSWYQSLGNTVNSTGKLHVVTVGAGAEIRAVSY